MNSLIKAELVEDEEDDEEFVRFTDQMSNTLTLPLANFVPKYEERPLGRKLSTLVLTETSVNLVRLLNELLQKQALYHTLQNELVESSAFWIKNYSSIALQTASSELEPIHAKRRKIQPNVEPKKTKGIARAEELTGRSSLEKVAEAAWNGFCYIDIEDIAVEDFDLENTEKLVKEIGLQMEPGKLVINVVAYGPSGDNVPRVNQQTVSQFHFKALSAKDLLSAVKQIQASGGQLKYFPGGKVLASVYRLEQQVDRNVEQYITAKEQFVTGGIMKKLTNQDWVRLCVEGKVMFDDEEQGDAHVRRLMTSFDIWSKHQIEAVISLVHKCEGPLLHQVLKMISNFEIKGLTPSEGQIRKKSSLI